MTRRQFDLRIFASLLAFTSVAGAADVADRALLQAVIDGSPAAVEAALDAGGDPTVALGREYESKTLCRATEPGREAVLEMLLDAGADANVLYERADSLSRDPLTCAAYNNNLEAFRMLHEAGAELERNLCPTCPTDVVRTVFWSATDQDTHHILRYMIENTTIDEGERRLIKLAIEQQATYADDDTLDDRDWVIAWMRERGETIDPRAPGDPRFVPKRSDQLEAEAGSR